MFARTCDDGIYARNGLNGRHAKDLQQPVRPPAHPADRVYYIIYVWVMLRVRFFFLLFCFSYMQMSSGYKMATWKGIILYCKCAAANTTTFTTDAESISLVITVLPRVMKNRNFSSHNRIILIMYNTYTIKQKKKTAFLLCDIICFDNDDAYGLPFILGLLQNRT